MDYSELCRVMDENYCTWRRHHEDHYLDEHIFQWFKTDCGHDYYESLTDDRIPESDDFEYCPWCRMPINYR